MRLPMSLSSWDLHVSRKASPKQLSCLLLSSSLSPVSNFQISLCVPSLIPYMLFFYFFSRYSSHMPPWSVFCLCVCLFLSHWFSIPLSPSCLLCLLSHSHPLQWASLIAFSWFEEEIWCATVKATVYRTVMIIACFAELILRLFRVPKETMSIAKWWQRMWNKWHSVNRCEYSSQRY